MAFVHTPCRSGWPSGVRGATHGRDGAGAFAGAAGVCAAARVGITANIVMPAKITLIDATEHCLLISFCATNDTRARAPGGWGLGGWGLRSGSTQGPVDATSPTHVPSPPVPDRAPSPEPPVPSEC